MDNEIGNLLSSALRAISEKKNVAVKIQDRNSPDIKFEDSDIAIPASYISDDRNLPFIRGVADSHALFLKYHDDLIHDNYAPDNEKARQIFDMAEKARVDAIGSLEMDGVAENINAKIAHDLAGSDEKKISLSDLIYLLIKEEITGKKSPDVIESVLRQRKKITKSQIKDHLDKLKVNMSDQENFAQEVVRLINDLSNLKENKKERKQEQEPKPQSNESKESSEEKSGSGDSEKTESSGKSKAQESEASSEVASDTRDEVTSSDTKLSHRHNWIDHDEPANDYKIYTAEFDQIVKAEDLFADDEQMQLKKQFDKKMEQIKNIPKQHANKFLRKLMAIQKRNWELNQEEGIIDSGKLALLIADPAYEAFYKQENETKNNNTIVSLLIDNSGSMRGRPITVAAMSAEILAKTLEICGIKVEILGFTTVEWKGGKSRKKWMDNGAPNNPGRLNDLRHIIYKSADTPFRRAKNNLALMLKEGILKENIDGEAILWACGRLAFRPEDRKILMVISDGAPVDDSTISTNSPSCLDNHIRRVIKFIEDKTRIELVAIGIGHDVTRYYSNAVTIKEIEDLGNTMFKQLSDLFDVRDAA